MAQPKMVKVFTKVPGDVRRIGTFGEASESEPAWVPEDVVIDLGDEFRVERDGGEVPADATRVDEPVNRKGLRARKE